jgi:AsmA protein
MSRRAVLFLALIALAVLGAAAFPWTLSDSGLNRRIAIYLEENFDVELTVHGRSTIAFLPLPRLKFENVSLAAPATGLRADGGTLRAELELLPLLLGRTEPSELALDGSRASIDPAVARHVDWTTIARRAEPSARFPRLVLTGVTVEQQGQAENRLDEVNAVVNWARPDEPLDLVGSLRWRGEAVRIAQLSLTPGLVADNKVTPYVIAIAAPSGKLALKGEAQFGSDPRITGQGDVDAASLRDLVRWSGLSLPLSTSLGRVAVSGDFMLTRRRLSWPSVAVKLGADELEGSLSVQLDGPRPVVGGTLDADSLDLSPFFQPFRDARTGAGSWSDEPLDLSSATAADLDLRLSATSARIGAVRLSEMAASVIVKPGQIEASLGRASLNDGTVKGRLTLTARNDGVDVKAQSSWDRVDLGAFLQSIDDPKWITGRAQGQLALEGTGRTAAEIMRTSHGRAGIALRQGEVIGIGLNEVIRRIESRPLAASLDWKGGRTPFEVAEVNLAIEDGAGDVVDGRLVAPGARAVLQGKVLLADRALQLRALVDSAAPTAVIAPLIIFDINGGWDAVNISPDAKSLIRRSGAAQPLFGPEGPSAPVRSLARAQ